MIHALAAVLLQTAFAAQAQEDPLPPPSHGRVESTLLFIPRLSAVSGVMDEGLDLRYEDVWRTGVGLTVESDLLFPLDATWKVGLYFSGGFDAFAGDSVTDDLGDTLDADGLFTSHLLVGFKAMHAPHKGIFFDGRLGLGAVFYSRATGTITISGVPQDVDLIDASSVFAAEVGVHVGYSAPHVFIAAGFALRTQGAPTESDDVAFADMKGAGVFSVEIELGFSF